MKFPPAKMSMSVSDLNNLPSSQALHNVEANTEANKETYSSRDHGDEFYKEYLLTRLEVLRNRKTV
jgi:hypothetical protein